MTVGIKVLGPNSYELSITDSDTASNIQEAVHGAVTGIWDSGSYEMADSLAVSQFDAGSLEDAIVLPVTVLEGTGSIAVDPAVGKKAFLFNSSTLMTEIDFSAKEWTLEFDYIRTSASDWPMGFTDAVNPNTGKPYVHFYKDGTAIVSFGTSTQSISFGTVSLNVPHRYTLTLKDNKVYALIDGQLVIQSAELAVGWDPAASHGSISISGTSNRRATTGSGWYNTRFALGFSSGKLYWEVRVNGTSSVMLGLALSNMAVSNNFGSAANTLGLYLGNNWYNSTGATTHSNGNTTAAVGSIVMFALDMDNRTLYVGFNGVWMNGGVPTSGTAKTGVMVSNIPANTWYPAASCAGADITLRAVASEFSYTVPQGYKPIAYTESTHTAVSTSGPADVKAFRLGASKGGFSVGASGVWDRTKADSDLSSGFSNGDKTTLGSAGGGWSPVRVVGGHSSGKRYWEIRIDRTSPSGMNLMLGICNSAFTAWDGGHFGSGSAAAGLYLAYTTPNTYGTISGATSNTISGTSTNTAGTVYMFALDMDKRCLFVGCNGVWLGSANPALAGTSGALLTNLPANTYYPIAAHYYDDQVTMRSMPNEFSYAIPAGFSAFGGENDPVVFSSGYMRNLRMSNAARWISNYTVDISVAHPFGVSEDSGWDIVTNYAAMNDALGSTTFKSVKSTSSVKLTNNLDAGVFEAAQRMWELYDAAAGANARCYRAITKDGTYKYVVVEPVGVDYVLTKVYESWDATLHVGTNLAEGSQNAAGAQRTLSGAQLNVFATDRWLAMFSTKGTGQYGGLSGCFEISRDDGAEPIGSFPRFAWLNQAMLYGYAMPKAAWGLSDAGQTYNCFSLPRTITGGVGADAQKYQMVGSIANHMKATETCYTYYCTRGSRGQYSTWPYAYVNYSVSTQGPVWRRSLESMLPTGSNPWATGEGSNFVFSAYAIDTDPASYHIRGRFYGLKLLANNVGSSMDTINIKIDEDGMYSQSGVSKNHAVVRIATGGCVAIPL